MFISYYSSVLLTHLIIQSPRVIIQMISLELSFDICGFCLKICILCSILLVDFVWHIVHPELCVCCTMFLMFCINGCCLCIWINHWYLTLEGLVGELIGRGVGRCLCIYQFTNNFSFTIYQISNVYTFTCWQRVDIKEYFGNRFLDVDNGFMSSIFFSFSLRWTACL